MRNSNRLTALQVTRLNMPGRYADGGGLYLQISQWRTKSWLLRFERNGRERQMGLGPIAIVSLADARERAKAARRLILDGHDPIEERKQSQLAGRIAAAKQATFEQCAEAFIKAHAPSWRNEKHRAQWHSTLENYVYPVFGKLPVSEIDTGLVLKVLEPIWNDKYETASRLRGRIKVILDWAKVSGYRGGDNPATWSGHLDHLLARRSRLAPRHHPALPYLELPAFMAELREHEGISPRALEFLILTAARTGEVIGAQVREIDIEAKLWVVPPERTKSGREHRVPLCERALEILHSLPLPNRADAFVFAGGQAGRPLSSMALLEVMRGMRPGYVPHGFRSTFKTWASEETSHENIVTEMALAHAVGDDVEAAYRRGDLLQRRRALMDDWAAYCDSDQRLNNVLPLRRSK
jgi:integrase